MVSEASMVETLIDKYGSSKNGLMVILQDIQSEYNYLPREALIVVSQRLRIPLIDVLGVATFYKAFSLKPRGEHKVTVCMGTACHIRGGPKVLDEFQKKLNVEAGETTEDNKFTLETVNCLGCCAIGPVVVVDGEYFAQTTTRKVDSIINKYAKKGKGKK